MIRPIQTSSRIWRIEGDRRIFNPSCISQNAFVVSLAPEGLFTGGWGNGGKSIGLCVKGLTLSMLYPHNVGAVCRKVKADMVDSTIPKLRQVVGEDIWHRGVVGGDRDPSHLVFPNGSSIAFLGFDRKEKFLSADYGWIAIDECNEVTEDDWEFAAGRLRLPEDITPFCPIFGACNPDSPAHFLYARFQPDEGSHKIYAPLEPCGVCSGSCELEQWYVDDETGRIWAEAAPCARCEGSGQVRELVGEVVVAGPEENDENLPEHYRKRKKRLTGVRYLRYGLGKWVAFAGMVYDCLSPDVHLVDPPASWEPWGWYPPPDWPRFRSIDFGYTAPFVCQWWTISPDRTYYLYREIYMTRRTVRAHAEVMKREEGREREAITERWLEREREKHDVWEWQRIEPELKPPRLRFLATYCDHDAEDRATLVECGFPNTPANKAKKPGLEKVYELLQPFEVEGQLHSRIRFVRAGPRWPALGLVEEDLSLTEGKKQPINTWQEFGSYLWLPKTEGRAVKEDTVPDKDHGMDATRYGIFTHETGADLHFMEVRMPD